ncbi:MAG: CoB--CoM heterodisulfide reductase iron-sulfur subunit B family protein [Acidobacteriota bacterium]|jgi:heterodisulfide reductase subunit B|nr:CoB--CoM heterodisulfide reductase iron-sulfur subunit B family protein [Acidobacteriota bacterium]
MKDFSYFPGCSLHGTSKEFDESVHGVLSLLDVKLHELDDWTCCGATSAHALDEKLAVEMPARNLAIAEKANLDLLVPCASCYSRFKGAEYAVKQHGEKNSFDYKGNVPIRFVTDYLCDKEQVTEIKKKLVKKLTGLKAVCYYGCLPVRPPKLTGIKDYENPMHMDNLLRQLGSDPLQWSYKTDCCGASLMFTRLDIFKKLIGKILTKAKETGADCMVACCSMCQMNMDTRQQEVEKDLGKAIGLPVLYYTELIGLAMGHPDVEKWLKRHFVDPIPMLRSKGLL